MTGQTQQENKTAEKKPLWVPDPVLSRSCQMASFATKIGKNQADFDSLWRWSIENIEEFWSSLWDFCDVIGEKGNVILADADLDASQVGRVLDFASHLQVQGFKALACLRPQHLIVQFPVVAEDPVEDLETQVPAPSLTFDILEKPDTLHAVKIPPYVLLLTQLGEKFLTVMAEGCVADIMTQGDGFNEVLV